MELRGLDVGIRPWAEYLVSAIRQAGFRVRVTSVLRSRERQAQLYAARLAGRHPYPVAPPGRSAHEWGLAWDMVTEPYGVLYDAGALWRSWGGTWSERDPIHFEVR